MMQGVTFQKFGGNSQLPSLLNALPQRDSTAVLMSFRGETERSAFPFTCAVYGGPGTPSATANTWHYASATAPMTFALPGVNVDATGNLTVSPITAFPFSLGTISISLAHPTFRGTVQASSAITGIHDFTIDGCLSDHDFQMAIQDAGISNALLAGFEVEDCSTSGSGAPDGYHVIIVSEPQVVTLAP
jgi:hypothetical protein